MKTGEGSCPGAGVAIGDERLSFGEVEQLLKRADTLADGGIIDLHKVRHMDSAGIALLLELTRRARTRGRTLRILGLHGKGLALVRFFSIDTLLDLDTSTTGPSDDN